MKSINTYTPKEYAAELYQSIKRQRQKLLRQIGDEELLKIDAESKAANEADPEAKKQFEAKAVKHDFNARALEMAYDALLLTPDQVYERVSKKMYKIEQPYEADK